MCVCCLSHSTLTRLKGVRGRAQTAQTSAERSKKNSRGSGGIASRVACRIPKVLKNHMVVLFVRGHRASGYGYSLVCGESPYTKLEGGRNLEGGPRPGTGGGKSAVDNAKQPSNRVRLQIDSRPIAALRALACAPQRRHANRPRAHGHTDTLLGPIALDCNHY